MKKIAILSIVLLSIIFFIQKVSDEKISDDNNFSKYRDPTLEQNLPFASSAPKKEQTNSPQRGLASAPTTNSTLEDEQKVIIQDSFDQLSQEILTIESDWSTLTKDLFENQLGLDKSSYENYIKLKEGFEEDKYEVYQNYHDDMIKKYGDNYTFNPSSEEISEMEDAIREQYFKFLEKEIGESNFNTYLETLSSFNDEIQKDHNKRGPLIIIDF